MFCWGIFIEGLQKAQKRLVQVFIRPGKELFLVDATLNPVGKVSEGVFERPVVTVDLEVPRRQWAVGTNVKLVKTSETPVGLFSAKHCAGAV